MPATEQRITPFQRVQPESHADTVENLYPEVPRHPRFKDVPGKTRPSPNRFRFVQSDDHDLVTQVLGVLDRVRIEALS